jgi:hypothetical protein
MTLTTDELVKAFIDALKEGQMDDVDLKDAFAKFDPRKIINDFDREVWSIALNYDTRDVRFIEVDGTFGTIMEVRPVIRHDIHVEYLH